MLSFFYAGEAPEPTERRLFADLNHAVKACEAADNFYGVGREVTYTPLTGPSPFLDMASDRPTLTDEQRRMGLRSLRHMGTDWGNYDYD